MSDLAYGWKNRWSQETLALQASALLKSPGWEPSLPECELSRRPWESLEEIGPDKVDQRVLGPRQEVIRVP